MPTPRIIAFTKDWNDVPTCTTHILREMGKSLPVLWVSSIGTRRPNLASGRDLGRILARLKRLFARAEWKENQLRVLSPLLIPKAESRLMRCLNRWLFAGYVRRERDWMGDGPLEYWCFVPNAVDLVERGARSAERGAGSLEHGAGSLEHGARSTERASGVGPRSHAVTQPRRHDAPHSMPQASRSTLIYYCVDDWSEFEHLDRAWMAGKEQALLQRADVVFATSRYLVDKCANSATSPVYYLPHGVEHAKFAKAVAARSAERGDRGLETGGKRSTLNAQRSTPNQAPSTERGARSAEGQGVGVSGCRSVEVSEWPSSALPATIGFYGNLHAWVDFPLIARLAVARPNWRFILIGPVGPDVDLGPLASLPNVDCPGRIEHDDLPGWCARFDAAIIPYDLQHPRMKSVNPVKARELLAAGVPLVAARLPDLEGLEPDILLATTVDEWLAALERQIARTDHQQISARQSNQDWTAKVGEIRRIVSPGPND